MNLLAKVTEFLTGGIGETLVETIKAYYPPSMTDSQKADIERAIRQSAREHEVRLMELAQSEQQQFDDRIRSSNCCCSL